ncbi:hypothetical protein JCM19037_1943 [Geomicrobium sp. JCM 19037]|uniref:hypothetical protein n=1 Tax=unclassified Geomicrobium TaxID=2628951 RepID=UPI00045F22BD|nr:hypothetical protein [Geomicrobium sp. JCM 19037]GAK03605.1 hypothetical protein JCM19037_1943 [Geomicrobium sp. JCM 19037]
MNKKLLYGALSAILSVGMLAACGEDAPEEPEGGIDEAPAEDGLDDEPMDEPADEPAEDPLGEDDEDPLGEEDEDPLGEEDDEDPLGADDDEEDDEV